MRRLSLTALVVAVAALAAGARAQELKTEEEKTIYSIGASIGKQLQTFSFTPAEMELVKRGLNDATSGKKTLVDPTQYAEQVNKLAETRLNAANAKLIAQQAPYYDKAAKEKGAQKLEGGVLYIPVKQGTGPNPKESDTVKVNYTGTLVDGRVFDASSRHGGPAEFPLTSIVQCWKVGIPKIKVGGSARLVCPAATAYGEQGRPPVIPGGATLVFEVELLEVKAPAK